MKRRLKLNTISSLLFEIVAIISGFILPRLTIKAYGSNINGLVNSITQFIGIISFLELGVGKVVQSSLYQPLTANDKAQISRIVKSAKNFFRHIAEIMLVYIFLLIIAYPWLSGNQYPWLFTAFLIVAMSISSFSQYYFGIVDRLLLTADQKGYIQYFLQAATLILNTVASVVLIKIGCSIQIVKLVSSLIFLIRPLLLTIYVKNNYQIDSSIVYKEEPIKQKWNGMAQHIAYVVLNDTDTIVLTLFSSLSDVSIYSVYHLVVYGVKRLFTSMTNGIEALFGTLWAKKELSQLEISFSWTEWLIHTGVVLVFGCTSLLILPFIEVYTNDVADAVYIQPLFAYVITAAHAFHCLRLPYNMIIFAGGRYKQTQNNYIIAAVMNIIISIVTVKLWGLVGVAIGTLVSMAYQTIWMAYYNSKHLMHRPITYFWKQLFVDGITIIVIVFTSGKLHAADNTYLAWMMLAIKQFSIALVVTGLINFIFYRKQSTKLLSAILHLTQK